MRNDGTYTTAPRWSGEEWKLVALYHAGVIDRKMLRALMAGTYRRGESAVNAKITEYRRKGLPENVGVLFT